MKVHLVYFYIDLSKAFNTINHETLVYELEYYSFRGIVVNGLRVILKIEIILFNSIQFIFRYQSCYSEHREVACGVPQGYIVGLYYS